MPRLSVLLPVRNGEATIRQAVRSTLRTLPRDADLHVLDDASTDATAAVLAAVTDPRLHVHRSTDGLGVAGGLTRLLAETDSEFVGRMDADDVCLPGRFRRSLAAMDDADVVFTTVVEWTPARRRVSPNSPVALGPAVFPLQLLLTNPVAHSTMVARRSALDAAGGYRDVPAEDYDLWLRCAAGGSRLRRLALPGLLYRLHGSQVTSAEGWRVRSWLDPLVADAYGDLAERLLGQRFPRLTSWAVQAPDDEEFEGGLATFAAAFRRAAADRPRADRIRLERTLEGRLAAVRRIRAAR